MEGTPGQVLGLRASSTDCGFFKMALGVAAVGGNGIASGRIGVEVSILCSGQPNENFALSA